MYILRALLINLHTRPPINIVHLIEFDDILDTELTNSILALAASASKAYGTCSRAFIKLESSETIPEKDKKRYEDLALSIFVKCNPRDVEPSLYDQAEAMAET